MRKILLFITMLIGFGLLTVSVPAFAYNALEGADCVHGGDSAICNRGQPNDPISGGDGLLAHIANIVSYIAGAAAVILIIVAGIRYITSGGDANAVSGAKNALIGAIIGLVVVILAKVLITFVVNRL